jgi:hypothetical protein
VEGHRDWFRAVVEEWKAIRGVTGRPTTAVEALRRRATRYPPPRQPLAALTSSAVARARKEELVVEAESLADSTEWGRRRAGSRR